MNDTNDNRDVTDDLDGLLIDWHRANRRAAETGRDRLLRALGKDEAGATPRPRPTILAGIGRSRYMRAAASFLLLVGVIAALAPWPTNPAFALELMVPDGGRLDAVDERGAVIGPCPLEHTDVEVGVSGRFARVTLRQRFHNDYDRKIEAVYTFPLSHRGAVDRMTMTIGDRVVVGEVKERGEARRVYEAARAQGYVASLLEQERPNIFTQSVANIEPNATIVVEISYVETVAVADGVYRFDFPMVVAPRYIPGRPVTSRAFVPAELEARSGVILRGPAQLTPGQPGQPGEMGEIGELGPLTAGKLRAMLEAAQPVAYPDAVWWGAGADAKLPAVWYPFEARYADGAKEIGWLYADGTGQVNGRWFFTDPRVAADLGTGFSADTDQVPDASRITPTPVRPPTRTGHDIALTMTIDTGGPAILGVDSEQHEITRHETARADREGPSRVTLSLRDQREIPNRDFLLSWRVAEEQIEEAHFAHRRDAEAPGFFTLMLRPPARVEDADLRRRELIFVLDSSGSMKGLPIEKAKSLMTRAIETLRDGDTFNVITFNNTADCLWDAPRPNTEVNRAAARAYVDRRQGGGGTEMRDAVLTALRPDPAKPEPLGPAGLADAADGRTVTVRVDGARLIPLLQDGAAPSVCDIRVRDDLRLRARIRRWTVARSFGPEPPAGRKFTLRGDWTTRDGRRVLDVGDAREVTEEERAAAVRFVFFLSDGEVGNDDAIIEAVREHAGHTRMFTVGIGSSPNRSLLDAMARAGRGRADYLSLEGDADAAVERFVRRVERPVLTDIAISFEGVAVQDTIPPLDEVPDLFDEEPIVIHGRYAEAGAGVLRLTGSTGRGRFERVVDVTLPARASEHDVVATLWARAKVDERMEAGDRAGVIALGEEFGIVTAHTSFVAVEKSRMTIGGAPMLVAIPIEMPAGQSWEGTLGGDPRWNEWQVAAIEHLGQDPAALESLAAQLLPAATVGEKEELAESNGFQVVADQELAEGSESVVGLERQLDRLSRHKFGKKEGTSRMQAEIDERLVNVEQLQLMQRSDDALPKLRISGPSWGLWSHDQVVNINGAPADSFAVITPAQQSVPEAGIADLVADPHRDDVALLGVPALEEAGRMGSYRRELRAAVEPAGNLDYFFAQGGTFRFDSTGLAEHHEANKLYFGYVANALGRRPAEGRRVEGESARALRLGETPILNELLKRSGSSLAWPAPAPTAAHLVLLVVTLAEGGQTEAALRVAAWLHRARPEFELGTRVFETLSDETQGNEERAARLRETAQAARQSIADAAAEGRRAAEVFRVLAQPLWPLAFPGRFSAEMCAEARRLLDADGRVLVTVLVADVAKAGRAEIGATGLAIVDESDSMPLLVGRAPATTLADLALLESVRRIEPTR